MFDEHNQRKLDEIFLMHSNEQKSSLKSNIKIENSGLSLEDIFFSLMPIFGGYHIAGQNGRKIPNNQKSANFLKTQI